MRSDSRERGRCVSVGVFKPAGRSLEETRRGVYPSQADSYQLLLLQ